MKIWSLFSYPYFIPNLSYFISFAEHKHKYLEKCISGLLCPYNESQTSPVLIWTPLTFSKNIFFCILQNKESHTGLEQHE